MRNINQLEFERIVNKFLWMSKEEMQKEIENPDTPVMELMLARIMAVSIKKGDQVRLTFILDRMLGKVRDKLDITQEIEKRSMHLQVEMSAAGASGLSLDSPNITMAQLEAFEQKIEKVRDNLAKAQPLVIEAAPTEPAIDPDLCDRHGNQMMWPPEPDEIKDADPKYLQVDPDDLA